MHPTFEAALDEATMAFGDLDEALAELPDLAVDWRPAAGTNSLAVLTRHAISAAKFLGATASGLGTVYSFTVIRQNGVPPFRERVPFVVATVDLDEAGARLIASMPTVEPDAARCGMRVRATFRPASDEIGFVDFAEA